jgi:hypothetical protein
MTRDCIAAYLLYSTCLFHEHRINCKFAYSDIPFQIGNPVYRTCRIAVPDLGDLPQEVMGSDSH